MLLPVCALAASAVMAQAEDVTVYAAAAVKAPLTTLAADYEKKSGNKVTLIFDTAGTTARRFRNSPTTLLITDISLIREAENKGTLREGASAPLGSTMAAVAVPPKSAKPDISTPEKLKAVLLGAKRIAVSDPARGATVGTHFMKVIDALGIKDQLMPKITFATDGVATMKLVIDEGVDIGVSQSSEILQSSRDSLVGPFPGEFALSTNFSLWHRDDVSPAIKDLVAALTGPDGREKLSAEGITPPGR
jgi:molybdate transport system substrate-binding protein